MTPNAQPPVTTQSVGEAASQMMAILAAMGLVFAFLAFIWFASDSTPSSATEAQHQAQQRAAALNR